MFKVGDFVIHKRDVCKIKEIKEKCFANCDYYILSPIEDLSLTISVPTENKSGLLRKIISKEEVELIINNIPNVELIEPNNGRLIENEYKILINSGKQEDLIRIIKTTFIRINDRKNCGKKIGEKDNNYFQMAEKYLYNEFSVALDMSYDEAKEYVEKKVSALAIN
jgi:CarD family transcriptional regulator